MGKLKCNIGEYGIILNKQEKFLILQLPINKEFTKELWMFPGGRLESGEQPELGLKREVFEETGLRVDVVIPAHTARWGIENPAKYSVFYMCRIIGKENIAISKEHVAYKWVDFEEINKISWHNINSKIASKKTKKLLLHGF